MKSRAIMASASVVALAMAVTPAAAQDDDEDVIVVTGYRQSVAEALDIKRDSTQVVDSIVAEDIGKFPDQNVVEALQRVTGVQVTDRSQGETSTVTIRGLPDVTTTWNGRNIFTAAGGSVALQDIPSSLVSRIDVFKTRAADQFEAGLAGQIDIVTRRPLDTEGFTASVAVNGRYHEQNDTIDPNINGLLSYSTETDIGRVGALFSASYNQFRFRDQSVTAGAAVPYATENPPAGFDELQLFGRDLYTPGLREGLPTAPGSTLDNGFEYYLARDAVFQSDLQGERQRPAASVALQWAPDDNATYTFEYLYQGYRQETFNSLHFQFVDWWGSLPDPVEDTFNLYPGTNIISDREVFNAFGFTSGDVSNGRTDTHAFALNGDWSLMDGKLDLVADLSYQTSEFTGDFFAARIERVAPEVYIDFNDNDGIPAWNFGDTQDLLTDPTAWTVAQLYDNATRDKGDAITFTVDGDYALDMGDKFRVNTLQFGTRYDQRGATAGVFENPAGVFLGQPFTNFPELYQVNDGFFDEANTPSSWLNISGPTLRANRDKYRAIWRDATGQPIVLEDEQEILDNFDVEQDTFSIYGILEGETEVAGRRLFGQVGLRYVNITTDSTFLQRDTLDLQSVSVEEDAVLPSVTVNYDATDNLKLRFNYGETIRRPGFGSINPFINFNPDINNDRLGNATGGNPELESTTSKNLDLAIEYYFGETNAIYATYFRKDIEGFVVTLPTILPKPNDLTDPVYADTDDFSFSRPTNGSDGVLNGLEIGFVYWPEQLPEALDGFGVLGSVTFLDSSQDNVPLRTLPDDTVLTADGVDFFGVSPLSYNVTAAYEKGNFDARLSYVWREEFLSRNEAPDFANPLGIWRRSDPSLDFSANYDITDKLAISFDAVNLTDTIQKEYYEWEGTGGPDLYNFGNLLISRTFQLGLRYDY